MPYDGIARMPGIGTERSYAFRHVLFSATDGVIRLPHVGVIDGSESRDPGHTGYLTTLRPGTIMGRITSTGLWVPSFVGALASAYTSGGTSLTVTAAQAVELSRIVGTSGTGELVAIGAPTVGGTVAATTFDHSAINTTSGVITVTSLGVDKHATTLIATADGRATMLGILDAGYGQKVTDPDGNDIDVRLESLLVGGIIDTNQIINYPSSTNTSLIAYIKANIKGKFLWNDDYGA